MFAKQISVELLETRITGQLLIKKKLDRGKFGIYYAMLENSKLEFVLKAFPKQGVSVALYQKELSVFRLSHDHVIKYFPSICSMTGFNLLLIEYAPYGDFFDLIEKGGMMDDIIIRTYFHQLIEGLEYIHSQGIAHLDLKLENIMLGQNFLLKIIDFDQAQNITDKHLTSAGTVGYRAPEVIARTCKDFQAADIYSAGAVLYALKTGEYPFMEMIDGRNTSKLFYYDTFVRDNDKFWKEKTLNKRDRKFFSEDFKTLINGMLANDLSSRFTIKDIKGSRWYNEPILDRNALKERMSAIAEQLMTP